MKRLLLIPLLLTGCVINRPTLVRKTTVDPSTKIVVTEEHLRVPTIAIWPGTTEVGKQKVTMGKTTLSSGTDSIREDSGGSTNAVATLESLSKILSQLLPK